jgi:hypothetical protein
MLAISFAAAMVLAILAAPAPVWAADRAPRIVVTTDGERDDIASMHRLLLYANDLDIEGIVSTSSRWHWAGDPTATPPVPANSWHGTEWIAELIDGGYRQAHPNLAANDRRYPTPERLLHVIKTGNITAQGEMAKDTQGSDWIKKILLDDDPGPVYLQAWGGTNTIAAALRSIEDQYKGTARWDAVYRKVSDKAFVYIIQDQDATYKEYLAKAWPDVRTIVNRNQFEAFAYTWSGYHPEPLLKYFRKDWIATNILEGPLMADYPLFGDPGSLCFSNPPTCEVGDWFSEGDSPSFLHTIPTGLRQLENPNWGGWGGRFVQVGPRLWTDDPDYLGVAKDKASDKSPYPLNQTTLAAATSTGADNAKVTSVSSQHGSLLTGLPRVFYAGDTVTIGTGATAETRIVEKAGTAVPQATALTENATSRTTNIKVAATAGYAPGDPLTIGSGPGQEQVTITTVGSPRLQTTLAAPAEAGATTIKLQSTGAFCIPGIGCFRDPVLRAGDVLEIGTGAEQLTATIESVGTPGATGGGVTLTGPLPRATAAGTSVLNRGGGISFTPALATAHAAGESVTSLGGGLTFSEPLRHAHAAGEPIVNYNSPHWPQARWADAVQNDMAARVDWTHKPYGSANHQPTVRVPRGTTDQPAKPGKRVQLSSVAHDPDGDKLTYRWWQYTEADTYARAIQIRGADTRTPSFAIPQDARAGETIHLVLQVTDDGAPPLTRYRRVIVTVR